MLIRFWLPSRMMWALVSALAGLFAALLWLHPMDVTRAQESVAPASIDSRWLAMLTAERVTLEGAADVEGAAAAGLTLHVIVDDGTVSGFAPSGGRIAVTAQRPGSAPLTTQTEPIDTEAGWLYATPIWMYISYEDPWSGFRPGDRITVTQGLQTLSLTVPTLGAMGFEATDVVTGASDPGVALKASLFPSLEPSQSYTATTVADGSGAFLFSFASIVDVQPGDTGWVRQTLDSARSVATRIVVPQLQMQVGSSRIRGSAAPRRVLTAQVLSGGTPVTGVFSTTSGSDGGFDFCLGICSNVQGDLLRLEPGQQVVLSTPGQTVTATVPALAVQADRAGQQVLGTVAPLTRVSVTHLTGPVDPYADLLSVRLDPATTVTATAGGDFSIPLSFFPADYGVVVARGSDGHLGFWRYAIPFVEIRLDPRQNEVVLRGQTSVGSTPVTVSVQGPSGYLKGHLIGASMNSNGLWLPGDPREGSPFRIDSLDVLTLETRSGIDLVLSIPQLDLRADVETQRITGHAPPGSSLDLHLDAVEPRDRYPSGYDVAVVAAADGAFALDLHDVRLIESSVASLRWVSPDGHVIVRSAPTAQSCLQTIAAITVGGNTVYAQLPVNVSAACAQPQVIHLFAPDGSEKGRAGFANPYSYGTEFPLFDPAGRPVRIQPGDRILIEAGAQSRSWTIPSLSLATNAARTEVSGLVGPQAVVTLTVKSAFAFEPFPLAVVTTTADSSGRLTAPLSLEIGDVVEARLAATPGQPVFQAYAVAAGIWVPLYQPLLSLLMPPLEPYTLSLQTARPISPVPFTGTADEHGYVQSGKYPYQSNWPLWGVQPGDRLDLAAGGLSRQVTVPELTAQLDAATRIVSGTAPPLRALFMELNPARPRLTTTSDANGRYTFVLPADVSLQARYTVNLLTDGGDRISVDVSGIRWWVRAGGHCADVMLPSSVTPVALELRTSANGLKASVDSEGQSLVWQSSWSACFPDTAQGTIQSGDRLVLRSAAMNWTFVVPTLTAQHDPRRRTVTGLGPVGSQVALWTSEGAWPWQQPLGRSVASDSTGQYGMDVSDLDYAPGRAVVVSVTDDLGNVTVRTLIWSGIQHWLPFVGHP